MKFFDPTVTLNSTQLTLLVQLLNTISAPSNHPRQRAVIQGLLEGRSDVSVERLFDALDFDRILRAFDSMTDRQFFYQTAILVSLADQIDSTDFEKDNTDISVGSCLLADALELSQGAASAMRAGVGQFIVSNWLNAKRGERMTQSAQLAQVS